MNDLDKSQPAIQESADAIPWAERITDHNRKIDEYLQNCLFRGCSAETTIPRVKSSLSRTLGRVELNDPTHPAGRRHLLFWELLHPEFGAPRKARLWRYEDEKLKRLSSLNLGGAPVDVIAACGVSRETAVAAIQNENKKLILVAYGFPEDGKFIEQRGIATAGGIRDVGICRLGTEMVVTGVRGSGNTVKLILWRVTKGGHSLTRWDDITTTDTFHENDPHLAMCQTGPDQLVTAIRDLDGKLKISSWRGSSLSGPLDDDDIAAQTIAAASQGSTATEIATETEDDCDA